MLCRNSQTYWNSRVGGGCGSIQNNEITVEEVYNASTVHVPACSVHCCAWLSSTCMCAYSAAMLPVDRFRCSPEGDRSCWWDSKRYQCEWDVTWRRENLDSHTALPMHPLMGLVPGKHHSLFELKVHFRVEPDLYEISDFILWADLASQSCCPQQHVPKSFWSGHTVREVGLAEWSEKRLSNEL